ncbi:MAG TPA: hypothetical protein VF789_32310 [Thermoanaerobaculia bacterium]
MKPASREAGLLRPPPRRLDLQQEQLMQEPQEGATHWKVIAQGNGHHSLHSARATEQTSLVQNAVWAFPEAATVIKQATPSNNSRALFIAQAPF